MPFRRRFLLRRWLWTLILILVASQSNIHFTVAQEPATGDVEAITIRAEASSGHYLSGEIITITGVVYAKPGMLFSIPVKSILTFTDQTGSLLGATTSDINGYFRIPIYMASSPGLITGAGRSPKITIKAVPFDKSTYKEGSQTIQFKAPGAGSPVTTVVTDKSVYDFDEKVSVTGLMTKNGKPVQGLVTIRMDDMIADSISTGLDGRYNAVFIPAMKNIRGQIDASQTTYHRLSVTSGENPDEQYSGSSAYFILLSQGANCIAGEVKAVQVTGTPRMIPLVENTSHLSTDLNIKSGDLLAHNSVLQTHKGDRISMELPFQAGRMNIGFNPQSSAKLLSCREKSGKGRIRILLNNPSQVLVDIQSSGGQLLDIRLLTAGAAIQGENSRYFVSLDEQGITTIVALKGIVNINDFQGSSLQLAPGMQAMFGVGEPAISIKPSLQSMDIDPALEKIVSSRIALFSTGVYHVFITGAALLILFFGIAITLWRKTGLQASLPEKTFYSMQTPATRIKGLYKKDSIPGEGVIAGLFVQTGNDRLFWIDLPYDGILIGRDSSNLLQLSNQTVSPQHARVIFENHNWVAIDLNSATGTFVNDIRIKKYVLRNRDRIRLGEVSMIFLQKEKRNNTTGKS